MDPLVFATRRPPWPIVDGPRIRAFRLIEGLARHFEVTLVTFADGPAYDATTATQADLEDALPGVRVQFVPYGRPLPGGARRNAFNRASDTFGHYDTPTMRDALRRLVAEQPSALLHLDDPGVALAGLHAGARCAVYSSHNVEYRIMRDIARRMPPAHRPFMELEWRKVRAEERRLWRQADLSLAVSKLDAEAFAGARRVEVAPNGSDAHAALPLPPLEPLRLLFVGALRFWPYGHGVAWFVREALPAIRAAAGPVTFDVVGEEADDLVHAEGVVYHGRVPDVKPFYERSHALVIPVFEGSGTRLKVVESALLGRPILSTGLGAEGLPVVEGEGYLRAEDAAGFAAAAKQLRGAIESGSIAADLAAMRGRVEHLTWPRIADDLAALYQSTSER
jgi:glycosyltransferase involved in cell wall biosynthesis